MKRYPIVALIILILYILLNGEKSGGENIDKLTSDLESSDWETRLSAVEQLGKIKNTRSIDLLMNVADTSGEAWQVRVRAIRLLGEIGDPKAIDTLAKIFNDPFLNFECPAIKWHTAIALGNFKKNPKVTDTLINGLKNEHLIIREASIQSLGKIGDSKAVPVLILFLQDRHFAIKVSVIKSLEEIGDPRAIPHLKHVADSDNDGLVKSTALSALGNFSSQEE